MIICCFFKLGKNANYSPKELSTTAAAAAGYVKAISATCIWPWMQTLKSVGLSCFNNKKDPAIWKVSFLGFLFSLHKLKASSIHGKRLRKPEYTILEHNFLQHIVLMRLTFWLLGVEINSWFANQTEVEGFPLVAEVISTTFKCCSEYNFHYVM